MLGRAHPPKALGSCRTSVLILGFLPAQINSDIALFIPAKSLESINKNKTQKHNFLFFVIDQLYPDILLNLLTESIRAGIDFTGSVNVKMISSAYNNLLYTFVPINIPLISSLCLIAIASAL
uniref:Uncharacterized protein n=1 Tax=Poecilia reticulata TaxID=8081 RepID=A0A3P9QBM6_POERE